jgi:hypothetical protein
VGTHYALKNGSDQLRRRDMISVPGGSAPTVPTAHSQAADLPISQGPSPSTRNQKHSLLTGLYLVQQPPRTSGRTQQEPARCTWKRQRSQPLIALLVWHNVLDVISSPTGTWLLRTLSPVYIGERATPSYLVFCFLNSTVSPASFLIQFPAGG